MLMSREKQLRAPSGECERGLLGEDGLLAKLPVSRRTLYTYLKDESEGK